MSVPIFFISTYNRLKEIKQMAYEQEYEKCNILSQFFTNEFIGNLIEKDTNDLIYLINLAKKESSINKISLIDTGFVVRYSSSPSELGKKLRVNPEQTQTFSKSQITKFIPLTQSSLKMNPFYKGLGYMQIVFTLEEAGRNITRAFFHELLIESSELIITLLVAWLIAGFLVKPLREMKNVALSIANGDFSLRVRTASKDVVGQLAMAFNNMADKLKDLTENLQTRVDEATVELRQKNAELLTSQKELEEANRQLMELDRMKSDFVAMVSHELRTPLTSIIGFAKTLQTLHLSPQQQKKYLGIIQQEGKTLSSFVEEYLDISNIESGTFYLQCSLQQLNQIIISVADAFQLSEGASIKLNLNPDLPLLFVDAEKIRHVIYNLLDNAVKYGGRGVTIIVSTRAEEDAVTVSVHNSGSEIEPSERDRIFEKLYRGEKARALHVRGSGLGLTIARAVVEGHGGRIWCDSDKHRGTTFFFTIPLQAHCDKFHLEKGNRTE